MIRNREEIRRALSERSGRGLGPPQEQIIEYCSGGGKSHRATHYVITGCAPGGMPGVVYVKKTIAPGSTTPATGEPQQYAWLGRDGFLRLGSACDCIPYSGKVANIAIPLKIIDQVLGARKYTIDTENLDPDQLDPTEAEDCGVNWIDLEE